MAPLYLTDHGQKTDAGTILVMIGFGMAAGIFVFLRRLPKVVRTRSGLRRLAPWVVAFGLAVGCLGLVVHHC